MPAPSHPRLNTARPQSLAQSRAQSLAQSLLLALPICWLGCADAPPAGEARRPEPPQLLQNDAQEMVLDDVVPQVPAAPAGDGAAAGEAPVAEGAPVAEAAAVPATELTAPGRPPIPGAPLNKEILSVLESYPTDGTYTYFWKRGKHTDGTSQTLRWGDTVLAEGNAEGQVHCSGITWEVWLRALQRAGGGEALAGKITGEELLALRATWYVEDGSIGGPVDALSRSGLARRITDYKDLKPGDLVQFWRNSGKGHSAIFIDHIRNADGSPRGIIYWSAQQSSGGLGKRRVSVGDGEFQIAPGKLYGARAILPEGAQRLARTEPSPPAAQSGPAPEAPGLSAEDQASAATPEAGRPEGPAAARAPSPLGDGPAAAVID